MIDIKNQLRGACDRCHGNISCYLVTISDGAVSKQESLCFNCYMESQEESITNVEILEH
jgi:hypothetical protein